MLKVHQEIDAYQVGGTDEGKKRDVPLVVRSHWNRNETVMLRIGDEEVFVAAKDLRAAIDNATNVPRV